MSSFIFIKVPFGTLIPIFFANNFDTNLFLTMLHESKLDPIYLRSNNSQRLAIIPSCPGLPYTILSII